MAAYSSLGLAAQYLSLVAEVASQERGRINLQMLMFLRAHLLRDSLSIKIMSNNLTVKISR
jgi:hypothetical protein